MLSIVDKMRPQSYKYAMFIWLVELDKLNKIDKDHYDNLMDLLKSSTALSDIEFIAQILTVKYGIEFVTTKDTF